jgi:hypothetical protein
MFFIAGSGHCGTKWLSTVLTDQNSKVVCFHEGRHNLTGITWEKAIEIQKATGFDGFGDYFNKVLSLQNNQGMKVGDSNSWSMETLCNEQKSQKLTKNISIDKVLFLIRNGIRTINSVIELNKRIKGHTRLMNSQPAVKKQWEDCVISWQEKNNISLEIDRRNDDWIATLPHLIYWAEGYSKSKLDVAKSIYGADFSIYRLEDLTTDIEFLGNLLQKFGISKNSEEIKKLQQRDVNRKVKNQDLDYIIKNWNNDLKNNFKKICGDTMEYHGYDIGILE